MKMRRRQLLGALAGLWSADALAMGRVPIGGKLELSLPWSTVRIDPHDLFDPLAAIFGTMIFDPVYGRDANGHVFPTLADGMPRVEDGQTVVRLRAGLRSA
ncbi:MAG TPA: hypothetical protein VFB62_12260, partial [Polyangiaceae bacterium]|nr:hypothetical protein [Polyangiaceae bacterium]